MSLAQRMSLGLTYAGGLAIVAMVGVILCDIIGRNLFDYSLVGSYELVQLTLVIAVYAGLSESFRQQAHIVVDLIDSLGNQTLVRVLSILALLLSFALLSILTVLCFLQAYDTWRFGDVTADLGIPRIWYWLGILVGFSATCVTLLELVVGLFASATRSAGAQARSEETGA